MNGRPSIPRLLLVGAGPRLAGAGGIALLLWFGFLWVTGPL